MRRSLLPHNSMLLKKSVLDGVVAGEVDLAFRRWKKATVRAGGQLRTRVGVLAIHAVTRTSLSAISAEQARRAGWATRKALLAELNSRTSGDVYRIELSFAGADPRRALRAKAASGAELALLIQGLAKIDAGSRNGAWTLDYLRLIDAHPATLAADLAQRLGVETPTFKARVRKLKELGLTESLAIGYKLAPRGRAVMKKL